MSEHFALTIDAVFSFPTGLTVTGKIERGIARAGMAVEITGAGRTTGAVVKRVETFGKVLKEAHAGQQVALVLDGVTKDDLAAGHVIRAGAASRVAAPGAPPPAAVATGPDPRFTHAEAEYARLREALEAGQTTPEAFENALAKLMFEYGGRYWMIGANTGQWYASHGDQWVTATPPQR